jgi:hypothetical protein
MINHTVTIRRHLAGNEARSYIAVVNILEEPDNPLSGSWSGREQEKIREGCLDSKIEVELQ